MYKNHFLQEPFWTIPNILSLYRIVIFPFIVFLILTGKEQLFAIFISISLFTDWLDGFIARTFNMRTRIGALLDSWADLGVFICAFLGIYFFKWPLMKPHAPMLLFFFIAWLAQYLMAFGRFGRLIGLHTYLFKITGYAQGIFMIILFLYGFVPWLFYMAMVIGIIACMEEIVIIAMLKEPLSDVKGLYWLRKNKIV